MRMEILVVVDSLTDAAKVEQALNAIGIEFTITTTGSGIRHAITPDIKKQVMHLREEGLSYEVIAREVGIASTTVSRIVLGTHKQPRVTSK